MTLAHLRKAARELLTLDEKDPRRLFEGAALLRRMNRYGLLSNEYWNWITFWVWHWTNYLIRGFRLEFINKDSKLNPFIKPECISDKDILKSEKI